MKTSVLKYYCFFILGLSASVFGQNYSVSFGGQNGNINFNDVAIESGDGITFSFWINDDWGHSNYPNGDAILDFGSTSYCTPHYRYIIKKKNGEIQAWFEGQGFSGYGGGSTVSTNMLEYNDQFVHVAVTFNGSEGKIYVNGEHVSSSSYTYGGDFLLTEYSENGVPCSNGQPSDIKLMGGEGNYFFDGYIDDFSLWSYDMGTDEVNDVMTLGVSDSENNLAGYWNFNQGSGTTVIDQTSNGNNGTISGDVSWSTDVPPILPVPGGNNSLSFDGVDDYVEIDDSDELDGMDNLTVQLWVKFNSYNDYSTGSEGYPIFGKVEIGEEANAESSYSLYTGHDEQRMSFLVSTDNNQSLGANLWDYEDHISLNQWHLITGIYDGSFVYLYIDGALKAQSSSITGSVKINEYPLRIASSLDVSYNNISK